MAGYTLFELLITLVIVALVAGLAGPSFLSIIERGRQQAALSGVFDALSTARVEAVTRQAPTAICASTDQATCNSSNFEDGWLVFVDDGAGAGTEGDGDIGGDEELLRVGQEAGADVTVRLRNFADAGAVMFTDDGMADERGTIVICTDNDPSKVSAVILNFSGQARLGVDEDDPADGLLDEDDGTEISSCP